MIADIIAIIDLRYIVENLRYINIFIMKWYTRYTIKRK